MSLIKRAYRFRCYPTSEQRQVLARAFGCCRWVYNQALAHKTTAYRAAGQRLSDARPFGAPAAVENAEGDHLAG
jgi:putative transposase